MYAKVSHQQRLISSASTPRAKASLTQHLHRLDGLTNPQKPVRLRADDKHKPLHDMNFFLHEVKHFNKQKFQKYSKTSPHPTTCTPKYRIKNVSSPAQARHEQKHPRMIETLSHQLNDFTNPQERARRRADDQQKPLHDPALFPHEPKASNIQIFQDILKLALTREHACQSIAS